MRELPFLSSMRADDAARYGHEFAARLAQWDAGGHELDAAEGAFFMENADPTLVLLSSYLDGSLTAEQAGAVRRHLVADRAALDAAVPMFIGAHLASVILESHPDAHPWRTGFLRVVKWTLVIALSLAAVLGMFVVGPRLQEAQRRAFVLHASPAAFAGDSTKFPFVIDTSMAK
jgi:hypothetical protein